jgi:hypothetical protein
VGNDFPSALAAAVREPASTIIVNARIAWSLSMWVNHFIKWISKIVIMVFIQSFKCMTVATEATSAAAQAHE